jgi:DNA-binding IclR family transcriptional regulator
MELYDDRAACSQKGQAGMAQSKDTPESADTKGRSDDTGGTVQRVIRLLQYVAEEGQFNLKEASSEVGLPSSTVHRLLQFLIRADLVERDKNQTYRLSREFFRLGSLAVQKFDINSAAHPHLVALVERFGETCSFAIYLPKRKMGMIVDTVPSSHPLQFVIEPFAPWTLAWGSVGRTMLAHLPDDEVAEILAAAPPSAASGQPAPSKESLSAELAGIKALGYYTSVSQRIPGATGTCAPVLGSEGRLIGSIGITIPLSRYRPETQDDINAEILRHASELSAALGYSGKIGR